MKHGYASYMRHFNIFTMSFADVGDFFYLRDRKISYEHGHR